MIKKIFFAIIALVAITCAIAATRSDEMNVTRSATIAAPPAAVFAVVNDFRQWDAWSPWSKIDPTMKKSIEGPPEGVGAIYHWSGNTQVGEGTTKLVESKPSERVGMRLEIVRPFAGASDVQFTFAPDGKGTKVTWAMQSKKPFIGKVMGLFINCDKMCGDQFNQGLENLRKIVEEPAKK